MKNQLLAVYLIVFLSTPTFAQDAVPLMEGSPAPMSGVLVTEKRMELFLRAETRVKDLEGRLEIQERMTDNMESLYVERLNEMSKQNGSDYNWLYFAGGVLTAVLLGYGAKKLN